MDNLVEYNDYEKITDDSGVLKKIIDHGFGTSPNNGDEVTGKIKYDLKLSPLRRQISRRENRR